MNIYDGTSQRAHALICSSDDDALQFMEITLSALSQYETTRIPVEALLKNFGKHNPEKFDLVIVDVGGGELLETPDITNARKHFAHVPVIFISDKLSDDRIRRLFLLEGSDWLCKPLEPRSFIDSVNTHIHTVKSSGNLVHAVLSTGGGAGGTTVAAMLASYLAKTQKRIKTKTALIDLDFATADCGAYLNIHNPYDLNNVIDNPTRIDLEFIDIVRKKHESGFSLFSFYKPELSLSPRADELVLRMLDVIVFQNDHTVLDIPYYETPWKQKILSTVNSITLVANNSLPALQQAKEMKNRIKHLRGESRTTQIIVNKTHRNVFFGTEIGKNEIKRVFNDQNFIITPYEHNMMLKALNQGKLPSEINSRSKFCLRIKQLAESLRTMA